MRVIKSRLKEMLPEVEVFLDVDNLGGGSDHPHIDISDVVTCFCTRRFFNSGPCAREVLRAILRKKPIVALLETDQSTAKGGLTEEQCRTILLDPEYLRKCKEDWGCLEGFRREWAQPDLQLPTSKEIVTAFFAQAPINWFRLADFQDVSMRVIAERLMQNGTRSYNQPYRQLCFMQGEIEQLFKQTPVRLPPLREDCRYHLYCSQYCKDADVIGRELEALVDGLTWTSNPFDLSSCEHIVVHLTSQTWMPTEESLSFAKEICLAMRAGVHRLLVHEVLGGRCGENEARHACSFDDLFGDDSTPKPLLRAGLYNEIAMNLAGDEWRMAGLIKMARDLGRAGEHARTL